MAMQQSMTQPGRPMSVNGPMDAQSPAQGITLQSPRNPPMNGVPGQMMQRNQSKTGHTEGAMLPPQSPAAAMGRTTPQTQPAKIALTPKMPKEELIVRHLSERNLRPLDANVL